MPGPIVKLNLDEFRTTYTQVVEEAPQSPRAQKLLLERKEQFELFRRNLPAIPTHQDLVEATARLREMAAICANAQEKAQQKYDDVRAKEPRIFFGIVPRSPRGTPDSNELWDRRKQLASQVREIGDLTAELLKKKVYIEDAKRALQQCEIVRAATAKQLNDATVPQDAKVYVDGMLVEHESVDKSLLTFVGADAYNFLVEELTSHCNPIVGRNDRPYVAPKSTPEASRELLISHKDDGRIELKMKSRIDLATDLNGEATATVEAILDVVIFPNRVTKVQARYNGIQLRETVSNFDAERFDKVFIENGKKAIRITGTAAS